MSERGIILNDSLHDQITYDLVINGSALDSSRQVLSIAVTREVNRIPTATVVLRDGEAADQEFALSNTEDFVPGNKIQINLGRDGANTPVFKGIIIKHRVRVRENGMAEMLVECRDESVRLTIGRHSHYYEESKDSEVMEAIIARYAGLTSDVEATDLSHRELVQHHCTDWDYLLSRAEANGRLVIVDDGQVRIKKPDTGADAVVEVAYGSTLLEFEAEMDARTQWKSVEAKAWDYTNQRLFERTSDTASVKEAGDIQGEKLADAIALKKLELRHGGQVLEAEMQQWADAAMLKSRLAKICGRAKFFGFAGIKPGDLISIQGIGKRFNGKVFVSGVRHNVGKGAWDTHVQFGLSPQWFHQSTDIMDTAASGLHPSVHGLQVGKVVQLQDDPEGEHRILVRLPVVDNEARGIWARAASLDAGGNRGAFFRPELEDEVIVGFVNGDPRDAIVLGMLHSSAKPAPITAKDVNHEKGFVTRSDMRIHFHDETKTITISTPAKNVIKLDEKEKTISITDQNNNTVVMKPGGITMESPKDITIKAGGAILIEATANLTMKAAQISATAQGSAKLKGATVDVAGSSTTRITGQPVSIN